MRARRGATNPIGAPSPACMRGWPQRTRASPDARRRGRAKHAAEAYESADALLADLHVIQNALAANGDGGLGRGGAVGRLIRLVETCGFYLATLDLRQNADVHERVVAELLAAAGVEADYGALAEEARVKLLRGELAGKRLLAFPGATYSEETSSELAILQRAAAALDRYGPGCIDNYIISKAQSISDVLEVYLLLKEAGVYRAGAPCPIMVTPLFETIEDLERAPKIMSELFALPEFARDGGGARASGSDGRLFRLQQGRRLSHLGVAPARGEPRAGAGVRERARGAAALPRPRRRGGARRRLVVRGYPRAAAGHGATGASASPSKAR